MWNVTSKTVLDYYEDILIPENIKVWYEVWENLYDIKNNHYYYQFEPTSLRYVLIEIIEHLEYTFSANNTSGKLKQILTQKLDYILRVDFVSKEIFPNEIKKLYELLNKPNKEEESIYLCKYILEKFNKGWHFQKAIEKLKDTVSNNVSCSIRELQLLSQFLIIELAEKGFSDYTIRNLLSNILNPQYHHFLNDHYDGKYFTTDLIFNLNENSSFKDRINFIQSLYKAPKFRCKLVFQILGAKIKNVKELKFGNITFHDRLYLEGEDDKKNGKIWVFDFQEKDLEFKPFIRATIDMEGIDFFEMNSIARNELLNAIDFLKYKHSYSERVNFIISDAMVVLTTTYKIIYQMASLSEMIEIPPRYEDFELLDLHKNELETVRKQGMDYGINKDVLEVNKIYIILEWIKKAESNYQHYENYFTSLWFALENLVRTKGQAIIESLINYLPAFYSNNFLLDVTNNLHNVHSMMVHRQKFVIIDTQLGIDCGLLSLDGKHFHWKPIEYGYDLKKLMPYLHDPYTIKRTEEISELYNNNELLLTHISLINSKIKYELNVMYKIRNDIVHSGKTNFRFLGYYCNRLKQTLDLILDKVVWQLTYFPHKKINEILGSQQFINELLIKKIVQKEKLTSIDWTHW